MKKIYLKTKILLAALAVLVVGSSSAQVDVSNGGPVTTYSTVSDAFGAINVGIHTGVISIKITGNTSEPSTPVALQASGTGSSYYSSVRIRPSVTATITGSPISGRSVIELFGADSVSIDGDILGGSIGRDLSIINTNTVGLTSVIRLIGDVAAPALGCVNDVIKNCVIKGNVDPMSTSPVSTIVGILAGGGTGASISAVTTIGNNFDNLLIENNEIKKTYYGVIVTGGTTAALCTHSLVIQKNTIGSTDSTEYNLNRGIYLSSCLAAKLYDNTIFNILPLNATTIAGIEVLGTIAVSGNDSIVRNKIYGIRMPSPSGFGAYGINLAAGNNHTLLNNVIYDIKTTNYSSTNTTLNAFGIRVASGANHKIYYNSINMYGSNTGTGTSCASAPLLIVSTLSTGLDIKNNIFNNKMSSTAATVRFYAVWFPASYNFTTTNLDYNAYMVSGNSLTHYIGGVGTGTQINLANWRTFSQFTNATNDVNSIPPSNGNAPFIADNNLNIANNMVTLIESGATILPAVGLPNSDYLLNARPKAGVNANTSPDIGAYEIDCIKDFLDVGVSAILKPVYNTSKCFNGVDTILIRIQNNYINPYSMTNRPIPVKVKVTGPNPATYTLSLSSGTLAPGATLDTLITLNYNMSKTGTYVFKAYTELASDAVFVNDTTTLTITKKPIFSISATPNDSVCKGSPVQLQVNYNPSYPVGNSTSLTSTFSYPTAFGNFWYQTWQQYLFKASELTAMGMSAGNITSISFSTSTIPSPNTPITDYNVNIAATTNTVLSAFVTTSITNVYGPTTVTASIGLNTINFTTPYNWDGVSNIVVDIRQTEFFGSGNAQTYYTTTPNNSVLYAYSTSNNPAYWTSSPIPTTSTSRPNIIFYQPSTISYSWAPTAGLSAYNISNPNISALNNTAVYSVSLTDATSGCIAKDTINLVVKATPAPSLGHDTLYCNLPVIISANTTANNYLWNTNAIASSINVTTPGQYWVRATNTNGCSNSDTVNITLGSTPIVTLGADTAYCQGNSINLYAGFGVGNTYLWSTGATSSFISVNSIGTYSVVVTNTLGCVNSDIINITSKPKPNVSLSFSGITNFCPTNAVGRLLTEGTPSGGTYIGAGVTGSTFFANQAGQGAHIITYNYTAPNGCSNIARDTLLVNACVGIEEFNDNMSLNVYPNPNTGVFTIEINSNTQLNAEIFIHSVDGKLVYKSLMDGNGFISKTINISDLANGIYYLKVSSKDSIKTYKLIKD